MGSSGGDLASTGAGLGCSTFPFTSCNSSAVRTGSAGRTGMTFLTSANFASGAVLASAAVGTARAAAVFHLWGLKNPFSQSTAGKRS